jgi:hypothetical protein
MRSGNVLWTLRGKGEPTRSHGRPDAPTPVDEHKLMRTTNPLTLPSYTFASTAMERNLEGDSAAKQVDSPWDAQDPAVIGFGSLSRDRRSATAVACPPPQAGSSSEWVFASFPSPHHCQLGTDWGSGFWPRELDSEHPMTILCRAMSRETSF